MMTSIILLEVMDKEPSLLIIWALAFIISGLGYYFCNTKYQFVFIIVPISAILSTVLLLEIHDPNVGEAIIKEAGESYVIQSYIAISISVIMPIVGAIKNYRRNLTSRST